MKRVLVISMLVTMLVIISVLFTGCGEEEPYKQSEMLKTTIEFCKENNIEYYEEGEDDISYASVRTSEGEELTDISVVDFMYDFGAKQIYNDGYDLISDVVEKEKSLGYDINFNNVNNDDVQYCSYFSNKDGLYFVEIRKGESLFVATVQEGGKVDEVKKLVDILIEK